MAKLPELHNVDQLRDRIDRGLTGEKVPHPDPSLVPLGTDAEAGGKPPTQAELALEARALEGAPRTSRWPTDINGLLLYVVFIAVFCAAVIFVVLFAS